MSMSRKKLFCLSQAFHRKLSFTNEYTALCFGKMTRSAGENLDMIFLYNNQEAVREITV